MKYKQDLQKKKNFTQLNCVGLLCEGIFQKEKNLYLNSIDFQKAFDSIKRDTLIYALKIQNTPFDN